MDLVGGPGKKKKKKKKKEKKKKINVGGFELEKDNFLQLKQHTFWCYSCLFGAVTSSKEGEMIGSRAAWTEVLKWSVAAH